MRRRRVLVRLERLERRIPLLGMVIGVCRTVHRFGEPEPPTGSVRVGSSTFASQEAARAEHPQLQLVRIRRVIVSNREELELERRQGISIDRVEA
jgi:hypothetical protein